MSCNYADGLSAYENKGVLGVPEVFEDDQSVNDKCEVLVSMLERAKHVVVHTGAGISTSAGIPDFRSPKGVWTLEKKGEKPNTNISFEEAVPTKTHMALKALVEKGYVHYIVSQNIDGLHLKTGLNRKFLAELHGNMFIEECTKCRRQYIRNTATTTVGKKPCGGHCKGGENSRPCRGGSLIDTILDWEHDLPDRDLEMASMHSTLADLNIALGTTLQIIPSGNLPLKNKKYDGKLVICNLQPTKHDKKASLRISTYVDDIMVKVTKRLGIEIPEYDPSLDPTKQINIHAEWTLPLDHIKQLQKAYDQKIKTSAKKRKSDNHLDSDSFVPKTLIYEKKEEDVCKNEPKQELNSGS